MAKVKTQDAGPSENQTRSKPATRAKPHLMIDPKLVDRVCAVPASIERLANRGRPKTRHEFDLICEVFRAFREHRDKINTGT